MELTSIGSAAPSAPDDARLERPTSAQILGNPLPHLEGRIVTRSLCRLLLTVFRRQLLGFTGRERIGVAQDPFILAMNHSQGPEAILIPTWLCFERGGRMVHFMADWNFQLMPIVGWIIRLHDPIHVVRKDARPRFLNRFKDRYRRLPPPFTEARYRLESGRSIGLFPEGTVNRHPTRMLRGHLGTARLSIETGIPVIPGGIRFPRHRGDGPIGDREPFSVHFGAPIHPPPVAPVSPPGIHEHHAQIMAAISTLCGKEWYADSSRTKHVFPPK